MNKKNIILIFVIILVLLFVYFFVSLFLKNFNNEKNKNSIIENNVLNNVEINNNDVFIKKYKEKGYNVSVDNDLICGQDLKCAYDLVKDCYNGRFIIPDIKNKKGYIVYNFVKKNNECSFAMRNADDPKDLLMCLINISNFNNNIFDEIFMFKNINKYCRI